jgi:hypothetical protein
VLKARVSPEQEGDRLVQNIQAKGMLPSFMLPVLPLPIILSLCFSTGIFVVINFEKGWWIWIPESLCLGFCGKQGIHTSTAMNYYMNMVNT